MVDEKQAEEDLTQLFAGAGAAHHEYEQKELGGKTDEKWAEFYADYLLDHGVNDYFEEKIVKKDLVEGLKTAAASKEKQAADVKWEMFYARFLLYDYT